MAAPKRNMTKNGGGNKFLHEQTRGKIQVTQLANRLAGNALGTLTDNDGNTITMDPGQVQSANILLKKALPDLTSMEVTGVDGSPLIPALNIARAQ